MAPRDPGRARLGAAIFLLSAAALLFQFAETRLFSAALDYHLTFLVISDALLGVGAAGTASALLDGTRRAPASWQLAVAAGASALLALFGGTRVEPREHGEATVVVVAYALGVLPVLFASWVIVRALRDHPRSSGALYAADLAGAAAGSLVGYVVIPQVGAQGLFGISAALPLVAAASLVASPTLLGAAMLRASLIAAGASVVFALAARGEELAAPRPGPDKAVVAWLERGAEREDVRWDPLARVDALRQERTQYYDILVDPRHIDWRPPATLLFLDLDATTPILAVDGVEDLKALDASLLAAPYVLVERPRVLVIGPGGGFDVLVALRRGAESVVGVEVNRTIVELMRTRYASYSGHLYSHPAVRIVEDEARSFVRRSTERYDLIVMTVVDSWAALANGAYALTESYLYTEEAFRDYVRHLSDDGIVAIARWYREPPAEMLRTAQVAAAGLRGLGVERPEEHLAVLKHGPFGLLLVRPRPFAEVELQRLRAFADELGFTMAYDPLRAAPPFAGALEAARRARAPATDDRPFLFDSSPLTPQLVLDALTWRAKLPRGYLTLYVALVTAAVLSYLLVLLPLRRRLGARAAEAPFALGAAYGAAFGLGFMFAEIVALQRLTLYLGQPSLAFSIGLAALLGGAACGAFLSRRFRGGIRSVALLAAALLLVALAAFPVLLDATLAWSLEARAATGLGLTALGAVPLGAALPRVIATVGARRHGVAWLWAVNGSASVVGSVVAVGVALAWGFSGLGSLAVACYALAALLPGEIALGAGAAAPERAGGPRATA